MISIITSLYKSDEYLDKYVQNLKKTAQALMNNGTEFELIVIANDPTAKESGLVDVFKNDHWFRYYAVEREPLYATWNRGVSLAKGENITFWNVDDNRTAEAIIDGMRLVEQGADLVYFSFTIKWYLKILGCAFFVKRKTIHPPLFNKTEFQRSMHCGPFFLFRKTLYNVIGSFDEQFRIVGDFDWCVRAAKATDKFFRSDKSAGIFRVDGRGLSSGGKPIHVAENNIVYRRNGIDDKIQPVPGGLEEKYDIEHIFVKGIKVEAK